MGSSSGPGSGSWAGSASGSGSDVWECSNHAARVTKGLETHSRLQGLQFLSSAPVLLEQCAALEPLPDSPEPRLS